MAGFFGYSVNRHWDYRPNSTKRTEDLTPLSLITIKTRAADNQTDLKILL